MYIPRRKIYNLSIDNTSSWHTVISKLLTSIAVSYHPFYTVA